MGSQADGTDEERRDKELQAITVGTLEPHNALITLAEYDPDWPRLFRREAARLRSVLGAEALRIEHVGSTSVPGLAAKPIVDILVGVASLDGVDLEPTGYLLRVREAGHLMFRTPELDVHVHVWASGSPNIAADLAFRDRLRGSAEDRAAYEALKRELATRDWPDRNHYAEAKGPLIREIAGRYQGSTSEAREAGSHSEK
jgi:GrpB-like predicted nucleotidyltransferase (UPF0157 family)